jgi:hypothetical protein
VHDRDIVRIDAAPAGELIEQADSWRLRHQQRGPDMIVVEQALEIRDVAQIGDIAANCCASGRASKSGASSPSRSGSTCARLKWTRPSNIKMRIGGSVTR